MLVDRGGLWYQVLVAMYREERGCLCEGGRRVSAWWREIARIREGIGDSGGWFGDCVSKKYHDRWQWQPDPDRGYSVCGAYQLVTYHQPIALDAVEELI
ncbi:hypothetical protein TSUD_284490 [Trifolium subterraneum]|uniref:Uncharacterized protein n=1 Tax=Trifolium subterraneum TaxID=3900 RepID=A0A2Z6P627_TRISU|nr:hypothetical protein TSUD_284490 [Trifolium subterraneum]